jgi:hypothetical protein
MNEVHNRSQELSFSNSVFDISNEFIDKFTLIFFNGFWQTINLFGIITNILNMICFVKQGFKDSINVSLLGELWSKYVKAF